MALLFSIWHLRRQCRICRGVVFECLRCHDLAAAEPLKLSVHQINRDRSTSTTQDAAIWRALPGHGSPGKNVVSQGHRKYRFTVRSSALLGKRSSPHESSIVSHKCGFTACLALHYRLEHSEGMTLECAGRTPSTFGTLVEPAPVSR